MATKFLCDNCGAELLSDAKFCGKCGNKVGAERTVKAPDAPNESMVKRTPRQSSNARLPKPPKQFEMLMKAIWLSIGLSAISGVIVLFDVREYYSFGQFGTFLIEAGGIALSIWLATSILKRQNWARVSFIVLTVVDCMMRCKFFNTDENIFCIFLDCAGMALGLYCVVLLFTDKIAHCFVKLTDGSKRAKIYWCAFVAYLVLGFVYMGYYQSACEAAYLNNCAEAAAKGFGDAYQDLIRYCEEHADVSRSDVDELVESKKRKAQNVNKRDGGTWTDTGRTVAKLSYWLSHGQFDDMFKWCGKIIRTFGKGLVVLGAILYGIVVWIKEAFIDGGKSK